MLSFNRMAARENQLFHQREFMHHAYLAKQHAIKSLRGHDAEMVYPNQSEAAEMIIRELFEKNVVAVSLIALPQVGKTGTFLEVAYRACVHPSDDKIIDPRNIFIITGMSDTDWQKQTKKDMLEAFQSRVYHRGKLNTPGREDGFYTNLINARNSLIIMDECHVAVGKDQQISKMLKDIGLLDLKVLRERNIKILEVSATPGATLRDTQKWGVENHSVVILNPSDRYVGFKRMVQDNRLHTSFDFTKEEDIHLMVSFVKHTFTKPLWHVIRLPAKARNNTFENTFQKICAKEGWTSMLHSASERVGDIDYHMTIEPKQHTFLLIKEFWRAGKRLIDTFVGIVHDPIVKNKDTNVTAQGLAGRLCGNDKRSGIDAPHIFCDTELINEYLIWIESGGNFDAIQKYRSRNLQIENGRTVRSKPTFADPSNIQNTEKREHKIIRYRIFDTKQAALEYCYYLQYNPKQPKRNEKGKYTTSIPATADRGGAVAQARKKEDIIQFGLHAGYFYGGTTEEGSRVLYPCYESSSSTDTGYEVKDISPELERFIVLIKKGTSPAKVLEADAKYVSVKKMLVLDPDNDKKIKWYNEDDIDTDVASFTKPKVY